MSSFLKIRETSRHLFLAIAFLHTILLILSPDAPGSPILHSGKWFFQCIQNPTIPELLTGGTFAKELGYLFFWSNKAPWTLSATQTWKLFLTKTPRLDEAFGLERFSASTPEKLSNLGAFKVPEMIRSGDLSWLTWNVCLNSPGTKKINAQRRLSPLCLHGKCHHPFKAG